MGEEEVTITFNFNSKEILVKIDPALLDAAEQEMKLYGYYELEFHSHH